MKNFLGALQFGLILISCAALGALGGKCHHQEQLQKQAVFQIEHNIPDSLIEEAYANHRDSVRRERNSKAFGLTPAQYQSIGLGSSVGLP